MTHRNRSASRLARSRRHLGRRVRKRAEKVPGVLLGGIEGEQRCPYPLRRYLSEAERFHRWLVWLSRDVARMAGVDR